MKILLFAHLREEAGDSSLSLELGSVTVSEMLQELNERYPNLSLGQIMVAVNEQIVDRHHLIGPEDIVALLPPVSGG